jgi:hypothetical protein
MEAQPGSRGVLLPLAIGTDAGRDQYADVLHFAAPAALQGKPIEMHIRELTVDPSIALDDFGLELAPVRIQ